MPTKPLSATKIRTIIALHWVSRLSYRELSKVFNVSSSTVGKYLSAFDRSGISLAQTRLLTDQALRELPCPARWVNVQAGLYLQSLIRHISLQSLMWKQRDYIVSNR